MTRKLVEDRVILDLCGGTGSWSLPYREAGYDVRVITLPENDVLTYEPPKGVYGILAAPPCDQFSYAKTTGKPRDLRAGWEVMNACMRIIAQCQFDIEGPYSKITPLKFWALENPYGMMRFFMGRPAFIFTPWEFGDAHKKKTHLWGHFNDPVKIYTNSADKTNAQNLPKFDRMKSKDIAPHLFGKLDRKARRAVTPQGFAKAFFEVNR